MDLQLLLQLTESAIRAARAAGQTIQGFLDRSVAVELKACGSSRTSQVVTEVDRACETVIRDLLHPTCAEHGLAWLSEESEDNGSRFARPYFWCIDPMDGTLPFINRQPGFSVSIALVARDGTPWIGVVHDPSTGHTYHAVRGHGAFQNGHTWRPKHVHTHLTYVGDRPLEDTPQAAAIRQRLDGIVERHGLQGIREMSGAGSVLNAIRVLEHGPAVVMKAPKPESGGGSLWDFAATACIFHELGHQATTFNAAPLDLNRRDSTFMNRDGVFFANLPS